MHRLLLPLLAVTCLASACATTTPRPGISVEPNSVRYGHNTVVTVRYPDPTMALFTGPAEATEQTLFPSPITAASLATEGDVLWLLGRDALIGLDWTGAEQVRLPMTGFDDGLLLQQGRIAVWGSQGYALFEQQGFQLRELQRRDINGGVRDLVFDEDSVLALTGNHTLYYQTAAIGGTTPLPASTQALAVQGRFLFVAAGTDGILVLDLFAEPAPKEVARYYTSGNAGDLVIDNAIAYVADGGNGLSVLDVSEPLNIRQLGSVHRLGEASRVGISGERALVANRQGQLIQVDIGNAFSPRVTGYWPGSDTAVPFTLHGDQAYLVRNNMVASADLTRPVLPAVSVEGLNLGGTRRAGLSGDLLYVADWFSGMHVYDISDPTRPRHKGNYHTPGSSKGILIEGDTAWVGDDDQGLQVLNISDPARPTRRSAMATTGLAYTMKKVGKLLYIADHRGGLHIVDVSRPKGRLIGSFKTPGKAWAVDVRDQVAFVADDNGGILSIDVSDPTHPQLISSFNPGGQAEDIVIRGTLAWCAFFDKGLYVIDISRPEAMKKLARLPIPGNARGIALDGDTAWVAAWYAGLQAVDISKPDQPRIIGRLDTDGAVWGVNLHRRRALLLDWWGGLKVADISDPRRPTLVSRYHARDTIRTLAIRGSYLWQAAGDGGLQVFDIRNALNPIWTTSLDVDGTVTDLALGREAIWFLSHDRDGRHRLHQADNRDPFYLHPQLNIELPAAARAIAGAHDKAYVLFEDGHVEYFNKESRDRWFSQPLLAQGVRQLSANEDHLFLAGDREIQVFRHHRLMSPASVLTSADPITSFDARAGLLVIHSAGRGFTLYTGRNSAYRQISRFSYAGPVHRVRLHQGKLLATTPKGLLTLDIDNRDQLHGGQFYPAAQTITGIAAIDDKVFFAGHPLMASVTLLPPTPVIEARPGQAGIRFPGTLPLGSYQIRGSTADGTVVSSELIEVELRRPKRPRLDAEMFKRMMKTPEPATTAP